MEICNQRYGRTTTKLSANPRALRDRSNRLLAIEIQTKHGLKTLPERPGSKHTVSGVKRELKSHTAIRKSFGVISDTEENKSDIIDPDTTTKGKSKLYDQQKRLGKLTYKSCSNISSGRYASVKQGVTTLTENHKVSISDRFYKATLKNQNFGKLLVAQKACDVSARSGKQTCNIKRSTEKNDQTKNDENNKKFVSMQKTQTNINVSSSSGTGSIRRGSKVLYKSDTSPVTSDGRHSNRDVTPHFSRRTFVSTKHVGVLKDSTKIVRDDMYPTGGTTGSNVIKQEWKGPKMMATRKDNGDKFDSDVHESAKNSLYKHRTKVKYKDKNTERVKGFDLKEETWRNASNSADNTLRRLSEGTIQVSKSKSNWKDIDSTTGTGLRRRRSLIPRARSSTQRANGTSDCDRNDTNKQGLLQSSPAARGAVLSRRVKVCTRGEGQMITDHMEIPGQSDSSQVNYRSLDNHKHSTINTGNVRRLSCPVFTGTSLNHKGVSTSNRSNPGRNNRKSVLNINNETSDQSGSVLTTVDLSNSVDTRKLRHELSKIPTPTTFRRTSCTSTLSESCSDEVSGAEKFHYNKTDGSVNTNTGSKGCTTDGISKHAEETGRENGTDVHGSYCGIETVTYHNDSDKPRNENMSAPAKHRQDSDEVDTNYHSATDSPFSGRIDIEKDVNTTKLVIETQHGGSVESSANLNKLSVTESQCKTTDARESAKADVPYQRRSISSLINDLPQSRGALKRFYEENVEERSPSLIPWRTFSFPDLYTDENSSMLSTVGDSQKGLIKSATCEENLGKCVAVRSSSCHQLLSEDTPQKTGNVRYHNRHGSLPRRLIQSYHRNTTDGTAGDTCATVIQTSDDKVMNGVGGCNKKEDYTEGVDSQREQEVITRTKSTGTGKNSSKLPRHVLPVQHDSTDRSRIDTGNTDKRTGTGRSTSDDQYGADHQAASAVCVQYSPSVGLTTRSSARANEACTVTTGSNSSDHFRLIENNGSVLCGELKGVLSSVTREDTGVGRLVLEQENTGFSGNIGENRTSVFTRRSRVDIGVPGHIRTTKEVTPVAGHNTSVTGDNTGSTDASSPDLQDTKYTGLQTPTVVPNVVPSSTKLYNLVDEGKKSNTSALGKRFHFQDKSKCVLTSEKQTWDITNSDSVRNQTTCDDIISPDDLVRPGEAISSGIDNNRELETDVGTAVHHPPQQGEVELLPYKSTDDTIPEQTTLTRDPLHDVTRVKMNKKSLSKYSSSTTKRTSGNVKTAQLSTLKQGREESLTLKSHSNRTKLPTAETNSDGVKSTAVSSALFKKTKFQTGINGTKCTANVIPNHETGVKVKLRSSVGTDNIGKISRDQKRIPIRRNDKPSHPDYTKRCKTFVNEQKTTLVAPANSRKTRNSVSSKQPTTVVNDKAIPSNISPGIGNLSSEVPADREIRQVGSITENNTLVLSRDKKVNKTPQITTGGVITTGNQISDTSQTKGIRVGENCTPAKKISSADNKSSLETSSTFNEITQLANHFGRVGTQSISHGLDIPSGSSQYCYSDVTTVTEDISDKRSSSSNLHTRNVDNAGWSDAVLSDGGAEPCTEQLTGINVSEINSEADEVDDESDRSISCDHTTYNVTTYRRNNNSNYISSNAEILHHHGVDRTDQSACDRDVFSLTRDQQHVVPPQTGLGTGTRDVGCDISRHPSVAESQDVYRDCDRPINSRQVCIEHNTDATRVNTAASPHVMSDTNDGQSGTCETNDSDISTHGEVICRIIENEDEEIHHSMTELNTLTRNITDTADDISDTVTDDVIQNEVTYDETDYIVTCDGISNSDGGQSERHVDDVLNEVMMCYDGNDISDSVISCVSSDYVINTPRSDTECVPKGTASTVNTARDNVPDTAFIPGDEDKLDHDVQGMLHPDPISKDIKPEKSQKSVLSVKQEFNASGTGLVRLKSKQDKSTGSGGAKSNQGTNNKSPLSPPNCLQKNKTSSSAMHGTGFISKVKAIKKPRTSTPVNDRSTTGKQIAPGTHSSALKSSKTSSERSKQTFKLQPTSKITKTSPGSTNSGNVCLVSKQTSDLSKERSVSRETSPAHSVSSDGKRSKSSMGSASSISGPPSLVVKEKKDSVNLVNKRTNTKCDNVPKNVKCQTERSKGRLKSPEVNEAKVKSQGIGQQDNRNSSHGRTIASNNKAVSGARNLALKPGKGEVTTAAKSGSVTSLKETSKTSMEFKKDSEPIKKSKVARYEKSTESKDNKGFQVSTNTKPDVDKPMDSLSSTVPFDRRESSLSASSSDPTNRCVTQPSRPNSARSNPQTHGSKRLSDRPSHMKNKSSSTSALPRQSSQSNKQTSSTSMANVKQNRQSAIPSPTPTPLTRVPKPHTSAGQINKPSRATIDVKQQSEHESLQNMSVNKMSKRAMSSKVKSVPTIHRPTKELSPVEQSKRSRSSTPSEASSEISDTGSKLSRQSNTGKLSTTAQNNVLLKHRQSSVPKPSRARTGTQKRIGNSDKIGEKCKEINRPRVPKTLISSPKNKRSLDYKHLNTRTKIEITTESSPESDSSPTLTCCDPRDTCDGSPLDLMMSLPVTPASPRFLSARSSMGGTPFTTPPEESKHFVLYERSLMESSKSLIKTDEHFVDADERALLEASDLLPVNFNSENGGTSENNTSSGKVGIRPLTTVNSSRCENSEGNTGLTKPGSKTLKVWKSDISDQLVLSEASNIKAPAAGCRQNVDIASYSEYVEQLSIGEKSEISAITSRMATESPATLSDGGRSDTGTASSDDYFSVSEEDEVDTSSKNINTCALHVPNAASVGSLNRQSSDFDTKVDSGYGNSERDVACDNYTCRVDNRVIETFQQTGEIIQSGPNEGVLSEYRDTQTTSSNTNDRFIHQTSNNSSDSIHSGDSAGVKSHHSQDNSFANKTPFDLKCENITHHPKSDLDSKAVLINSVGLGKNCVPDKNQYVSTDYEAVVPVQANLGEYFDDGNDKLEMQINDEEGVSQDSNGIKRGGGSVGAEGVFTGIMDNITDLSFQNILTNQNNLDGIPTVSNIKPQTLPGSGLLTSGTEGSDGGEKFNVRPVTVRTETGTLRSVTDDQRTDDCKSEPPETSACSPECKGDIESGTLSEEHREGSVIPDYYSGDEGQNYGVGELNVQCQDERDLTADSNDSGNKVVCDLESEDGVCDYKTENGIIGDISDSEVESEGELSSSQYQSEDEDEEYGDTAEMNGEVGHYKQHSMASRPPKTDTNVAMETSNTMYSPRRNLSSRNEATCIRKYEIVTTTITRHKKRETKIIDSSSKLSTGAARLHDRRGTYPTKNLVNSRSVKFETSKEIISTSDVDGKVFSTVKNSTNTEILGKFGNSSDAAVSPASSQLAALMQGETITMPECLERSGSIESMNEVKHSIDTLDSGDLKPAVSCSELLTDGLCDNTASLLQGSGDKKCESLETNPTLLSPVHGGRLLNAEGTRNPPPSPVLTTRLIRNPPPSPVLTRGHVTSFNDGQSPTLSPRLTRGDTKISVIKSRSNTTQTYNVVRRGKQCNDSIPDISRAIQTGQSGITTSVTERRQTVQSTYHRAPLSPNSSYDTLPKTETTSELNDSGANSVGLPPIEGTRDTDRPYLTTEPVSSSGLSSTSVTSENKDSIYDINTSYTDTDDHNGPASTTNTVIDTPKVAVLVTKESSDSDNEYLSESIDAGKPEKKVSRDVDEEHVGNKTKTSIYTVDSESKVKVGDTIPSVSVDPTVSSDVPDVISENSVTFTISLPTSESGAQDTEGNQSNPQPEETMSNEVTDTIPSSGVDTPQHTLSLDTIPDEQPMPPKSQTKDGTVNKDETTAKSAKAQRRENARQPLRRYTATVCLIDKDEDGSNMQTISPPSRPRARSKSPVDLKNTGPESQQQVSVFGNGRVSEMCRSFIQKAGKGKSAALTEEPPSSPLTQSPSPSRKLKWVRDNGVWKKVTPAEYERIMAAKSLTIPEITSSTEDVNQESGNNVSRTNEEQESQITDTIPVNNNDGLTDKSKCKNNESIHDSIPYIDNAVETASVEEEDSVQSDVDIQTLPKRNEQSLQEEIAVAEENISFKDNPFIKDAYNDRRDSLKGLGKDAVKTPPKTLPKPKHRRTRTDSGPQDVLPDTRTSEVTINEKCEDSQTVSSGTEGVDLDNTLTEFDSTKSGNETQQDVDGVTDESMPSVSDKTKEVPTPVKSQNDINDQNLVAQIDKIGENLSNRYTLPESKQNGVQYNTSISTNSRESSVQSNKAEDDTNVTITTTHETGNETCNNIPSSDATNITTGSTVDSNKPTLMDDSLLSSAKPEVDEKEKESVKDDSSPELERMSFAQKLKKAQSRLESKIETKEVVRSKKVVDRKQTDLTNRNVPENKRDDSHVSNDRQEDTSLNNSETRESPKQSFLPAVPNYVIGSPQKLRAIRIKQEIFPKEEPEQLKPKAIKKLTAVKISSETFPKEESTTSEIGGKLESRDSSPERHDIEDSGSKTPTNGPQLEPGQGTDQEDKFTTGSDSDNSPVDYTSLSLNRQTISSKGRQLPKRCINPVKFSYGEINGDNCGDLKLVGNNEADSSPETPTLTVQKELLSEIVELEENSGDDNSANVKNNKNEKERRPCHKSTSSAERYHSNKSSLSSRNFNRSHSLPTGTLSYGGSRIVYKDGHFVIETSYDGTEDVSIINGSYSETQDVDNGVGCDHLDDTDEHNRVNNNPHMRHLKRISYSDPHLCDNGDDDYDEDEDDVNNEDVDVFLGNDGNVTVIDTEDDDDRDNDTNVSEQVVQRRSKPENGSRIPRPLSVDENQLTSMQDTDPNSTMRKIRKSLRDARTRRSKSFREMSDQIDGKSKLKRNSSFKEATEKGALEMKSRSSSTGEECDSLSRSGSIGSIELRPKSPGFLQRLLFKRKSFNEKNLKGEQSTKESFMKKMSLKGLFTGKKEKGEFSPTKANSDEPPTPPIAAFQGDLDIHAVSESAPNSPFSSLKFRRRHTSADLFVQNTSNSANNLNVRRTSDSIPSRRPGLQSSRTIDDPASVKTLLGLENHPKRPISPKPPSVSITRRNSNLSLPSSPLKESPFELTMDNSPNKMDPDSISTCSSLTSSNVDSASLISAASTVCDTDGPKSSMPGSSSQDLEKFSALGQGEMTSSNSNDSGIQRDVSVHSSSESIKTNIQDSSSSVVRRRKSPSPRPERPKSEISVRWADLVETTEITPVKRREGSQRNKPRPKSDLEENLELFDELYGEVLDDLTSSWEGGSSLKSELKPFGSQSSLMPYNSLQSLDSLRLRQEAMDQKPSKRRMSTPQPIKTRLERAPRKQRTRKVTSTLVRSHSMPESLDKLQKCRKRHSALGCSNLHGDEFHHFDNDSSSDDGSDYSMDRISLHEKSLSVRSSQAHLSTLDEMPEGESLTCAEALWDHITMDPEELGFHAGDVIEVMDMGDKDWWWGAIDEREGWFPATFVRLRVNQEPYEEDLVSQSSEVTQLSPKLRRVSVINKEQARENVVNEIINAEREYVKHLKDVVEGYIKHARKRADMFSEDRISVIFGNIEDIYSFSNRFLESLDRAFPPIASDSPHLSELGHCFLTQSKEFEIYSDYCNNHPSASEELKDLYRKQKYRHFFEACRLLQEMIEIPLEGFLLTPVQKICKYPLQLAELLKYTPPSHPDYHNVEGALEAMKKIAALINERKRKMESIEKLARWQQGVEDWQGPDLLEKSSELITSGEFNKINSGGWSQERYFFLFDRQLVYCKKDLLKKNGFSYKGRVDLDECELLPVEDGKDLQYNVTVKNAWKLHETVRDKWYLLYTKTATEKQRWLRAFQKERQRVKEDQENNFVPLHWKKTVLNKLRASKEKFQSSQTTVSIQYQKEFLRGIPSHATLPRSYTKKQRDKKKGWSLFGNKKSSK
ncbi:LOW QUALITY PROTEIN: serine-rich adhesin for platelets-like [Argopecten irradians]|uniref:LOW QUALITY PROTEIN: serine-rich adhesin for platelets-like n=1 Tax=Argopecten irradians TaxID=31199 RepID=UPI00371B2541